MNWIDGFFFTVLIGSTLIGLYRGFAKEFISFFGWLTAMVLPKKLAPILAPLLPFQTGFHYAQIFLAYKICVIAVFITFLFLDWFLSRFFSFGIFLPFNKTLGSVVGLCRALLIIAGFGLFLKVANMQQGQDWDQAKSKSFITFFGDKARDQVPPMIKQFLPNL